MGGLIAHVTLSLKLATRLPTSEHFTPDMVDGPRTREMRDGFGHFHVFLSVVVLGPGVETPATRRLRE